MSVIASFLVSHTPRSSEKPPQIFKPSIALPAIEPYSLEYPYSLQLFAAFETNLGRPENTSPVEDASATVTHG